MKYSNTTIVELCRALGAVVESRRDLVLLFREFELSYDQFEGGIKPHADDLVDILCRRPDADNALTRVVEYVILGHSHSGRASIDRLVQLLRIDGFEWHDGKLIPTTPQPAALAQELSQLERDLQALMLNVAAEHYRQAHESFAASNWKPQTARSVLLWKTCLSNSGSENLRKPGLTP